MPYWMSSSRVGVQPALPNPKHVNNNNNNNNKQVKRADRFGRKGITMEDLKKQTALRLAQEQNRQNQGRSNYLNRPVATVGATAESPTRTSPQPQSSSVRDYSNHDPYVDTHPIAHPGRGQSLTPSGQLLSDFVVSNSPSSHPSSSYSLHPTGSFVETSPPNKQKSKLPHGLTVQELKEMTKARLQAEAANKTQTTDTQSRHAVSTRNLATPELLIKPVSMGMPSPVPPGFGPRSEPSYVREEPRAENWDNRAVAPEAYLGQSFVSDSEYNSSASFVRTNSFDANRHLSATMTPRMGLSYPLHEEREVEDLAPRGRTFSFEPSPPNPRERAFSSDPYQARERAFSSDPYEPRDRAFSSEPYDARDRAFSADLPLLQRSQQHLSNNSFSTPGNRARTSSAASMPPISHTADEFGLDISDRNNVRFSSHFGVVREDSPVTPGLADVFRVSSFDKSPLLPSLSSGGDHQDNRIRASTWSAPSMFGCGYISDDLASILKLSGAEDKNQY